jgi:hypothetical protein
MDLQLCSDGSFIGKAARKRVGSFYFLDSGRTA